MRDGQRVVTIRVNPSVKPKRKHQRSPAAPSTPQQQRSQPLSSPPGAPRPAPVKFPAGPSATPTPRQRLRARPSSPPPPAPDSCPPVKFEKDEPDYQWTWSSWNTNPPSPTVPSSSSDASAVDSAFSSLHLGGNGNDIVDAILKKLKQMEEDAAAATVSVSDETRQPRQRPAREPRARDSSIPSSVDTVRSVIEVEYDSPFTQESDNHPASSPADTFSPIAVDNMDPASAASPPAVVPANKEPTSTRISGESFSSIKVDLAKYVPTANPQSDPATGASSASSSFSPAKVDLAAYLPVSYESDDHSPRATGESFSPVKLDVAAYRQHFQSLRQLPSSSSVVRPLSRPLAASEPVPVPQPSSSSAKFSMGWKTVTAAALAATTAIAGLASYYWFSG
ncbi:hypothetical protein F4778DRAFT_735601 [Xylariomycetidae sp. FL2044]|nr:hypothetical protein F4778DRAFT_735601 [Xylariomycetidae sp. FL2044]